MIRERDEARAELERGGRPGCSVVIPCFNQAQYLGRSLDSVLAQTRPALEVIVVDDGSTADVHWSGEQVAARDGGETTLRHYRVSNRGLPNARNVGLMLARGEAFLPLDADDWLEPTFLERTLPLLADADVVHVGLQEHGPRTGTYMPGLYMPLSQLTVEVERVSNHLAYCALFRTRLLREVGGYNGRMVCGFEDWDLWIDLMQRGVRFAAVEEVLFNYRTSDDGMLMETINRHARWNRNEMARHHGFPPAAEDATGR